MKIRYAICTVCASMMLCNAVSAAEQAKWFIKKPETKKELKRRIDSLQRALDSVNAIIGDGSIPMVDTSSNDTINVGGLENFESEAYCYGVENPSVDSLLSSWYRQRSLQIAGIDSTDDMDSVYFDSTVPDSVYVERLKKMNSFISLPYNNVVRNHIIYYTTKIPKTMSTVLGLSVYYMPIFEEIMSSYDIPLELKVMAVIESSLNPVAVSRARAKGMWQFMYTTGKQYGLEITSYVDERLDPVKSAHAAARYLKDSYSIFGDWALAIASYNCGVGNVNKAIRRSGSRDFWTLYPYLPRETRGYVPAFVAALYTMKYYKEHRIEPVPCTMPAYVDTFHINRMLHFDQISEVAGIPKDVIRSLNPQYLHEIIPGVEHEYVLRLPYEYSAAFVDNIDSIYSYKSDKYFSPVNVEKIKKGVSMSSSRTVHTVRSGETLGGIAIKYRVKVSDIQGWNGLRSTMIRKGQKLVIYPGGSYTPSVSSGNRITHNVRSGETLGAIAERYKVSTASLRKWNNISGDMIRVGQTLTVYTKGAPVDTSTKDGYLMYTVRKGDTLWDIAKKFSGVTVNDIMKLNGFTKNSRIYPGAKIKIRPM